MIRSPFFSPSASSACWQTALWRHHPGADQDAAQLAAATLDFQRRFPMDVVKITPAGTYQAVDHGLVDSWCDDPLGRRTIVHQPVVDPGDWDRVAVADGIGQSASRILQTAALVRAETPPDVKLLVSVFSPLTQAIQLAGHNTVQLHLATAPQAILAGLSRLSAATMRLIRGYAAVGLDGIYLATQHMAHPFFSPEDYAVCGGGFDRECMAAAGSMTWNVLHAHGSSIHFSLPLTPANWSLHYELSAENLPLEQTLTHFSGRVLLGVPAQRLLEAGQSVDGVAALLQSLSSVMSEREKILSTGCVLPLAFPDSVIEACLMAASRGISA